MNLRDVGLASLVALVWGLTFIAIKLGVGEAPPFLLSALRFFFAAVPLVFFVAPPKAPFWLVVLYGLLIGVGQFGILFLAVRIGMPAGLASLLMQFQAYITIFFSWLWMGERPTRVQLIGAGVTLIGICAIASARLSGAALLPFLLTMVAACFWGAGNMVGKFVGKVDPLAFMAWSSLVAPGPMLALSFWFEDGRTLPALLHPTLMLVICVATLSYAGTLFGFGVWSRLLMRYPAAMVAPFALLVPVVGMVAGRLIFAEPTSAIEFVGAVLVMAGLSFNVLADRLRNPLRRRQG